MSTFSDERAAAEAIDRARACSPFLRSLLERGGPLVEAVGAGAFDEALRLAARAGEGADIAAALRRERSAYALVLAIGDLAGAFSFEQVTRTLSDLADRALDRAIAAALTERYPEAEPAGFAAIALGKQGGRELNYSSDIDPIFLFDPATLPRRAREEPGEAAVRIGQRVIDLLQRRTEDGFVFRVDLRLRPASEVTPIALPVEAAIGHYESSALPWERAAFIRARHAAGDAAVGRYFLDAIHPFIWRRSLDFGAIGEIHAMSGQIRDHHQRGQVFGPGFDLKRGRGGIRELEFFTQALQLIHGGREPALRSGSTLEALASLAAAGHVPAADAARLADDYRLLRTIEHRLQMVDDRQTHRLPETPDALDNVARLHGLDEGPALLALLAPAVTRVEAHYGGLAPAEAEQAVPQASDALRDRLRAAGFDDPGAAAGRIEHWRSGRPRALRTAPARAAFEAMLPGLLEAFGQAPAPLRSLNRFDQLVERLPSGVNLFRLLEARPALAQHLAAIMSHAPTLADQLGRRPELLDGLIDASAFAPAPDVESLAEELNRAERPGEDYQQLLDRVRARVNGLRFALGAQIVLGKADPLDVAHGYARVAEAAIRVLARAASAEFERAHGRVPGCDLVILGLGRLGGGELTHASDLDLIYLFSGSHEAVSNGARPLRATDYFNRLAPRVSAALSVQTAAGPLYDVDLRMRPSGGDGLLAISIESFGAYQRGSAWTFEHMALTRARPVYGPQQACAEVTTLLDAILTEPRHADPAAEAAAMRAEIARHKPPGGPFDIKLGPGGLVDLEFAVQVLQLSHGLARTPRLDEAIAILVAARLLPPSLGEAHRLLTRLLVTLRLVSPDSTEPAAASRPLVASVCGFADWDALLAAHAEARQEVAAAWQKIAAGEQAW